MPTNLGWYSRNQNRDYPLDESATRLDDAGQLLPQGVLVGLKLLSPESGGRYLYVGALTVRPAVVSLILMASNSLELPGEPVASFSQAQPITANRQLALASLMPGVAGWIVFPRTLDGISYSGKFSTPRQSLLAPAAAAWYAEPAIPSVGVFGQTPLHGLVRLQGGNDIEITRECLAIPGFPAPTYRPQSCRDDESGPGVYPRHVIMFRLIDKSTTQDANVFDVYRGPCGARPESETCPDPQPIQRLAQVPPDCCGNITIELRGCASITPIRQQVTTDENGDPVLSEEACGVVINCGLGVADTCVTKTKLPDEDGKLPSEYDDLCASVSVDSVTPPPVDPEEPFSVDSLSASANYAEEFPAGGFETIADYVVQSGAFDLEGANLVSQSGALRNVATYQPAGLPVTGYYRVVSATVSMQAGLVGSAHNAAILANFRAPAEDPNLRQYYVAEIDYDAVYRPYRSFRIARFNGERWINLFDVAVPGLKLEDQYTLSLSVYPQTDNNNAWLVARLLGVTDPGIDVTIGPLSVNGYGPASGYFGLATNRATTEFSAFSVDNTPIT